MPLGREEDSEDRVVEWVEEKTSEDLESVQVDMEGAGYCWLSVGCLKGDW